MKFLNSVLNAIITITVNTTVIFGQTDELIYNFKEDRWEYAAPDDELIYNFREDHWEYAAPDDELIYNFREDQWEYASSNAMFSDN